MKNILIAGGTGTIGIRLCAILLEKGYSVTVLSRKTDINQIKPLKALQEKHRHIRLAHWNVQSQTIEEQAVAEADCIVNLAGAGIADERWSAERKIEIVQSRTQSAALIIKGLRDVSNKVTTVINSSAIGWYGVDDKNSRGKGFTEDMPAANDYLGDTCKAWEDSISGVEELGKRLVIIRTGIVLSKDGGAFVEFKKPLNFRVAAILGNGKQIVSWIHVEDICNIYVHAIENEHVQGIYNSAAPHPVSNKELVLAMAKSKYGKGYLPMHVPAFALKIAMGEMSQEVLKSTTANAQKIIDSGFVFKYPTIDKAVADLLSKKQ